MLEKAKSDGKTVLFETGKDPYGWKDGTVNEIRGLLRYIDYFIPSLGEASALSNETTPEGMAEDLRKCGAGAVVITLNDCGCIAATPDGIISSAAFRCDVVDTLGAGDCFDAGFAYGLTQGWEIGRILEFCNALCSIFISGHDDRYPAKEEVERLIWKRK